MTLTRSAALALLGGTLLAAAPVTAQQAEDRFEPVRALIRAAIEKDSIPSIAIAVAKDGKILWEEGFGWADVERRIPATPNTMYSLASISKPMTATALMRLVEAGRVDLDRPANDYLGDGKLHSAVWDPSQATVRRVLSHTAGLPLHWEFFYEGESHPRRTTDEGIARFGTLVTRPGAVFQYSNLGYGVIDRIVERVSGLEYGDVMRTEVFEPLGLHRTTVSTGRGLDDSVAVRYDSKNRPVPFYDFDHRGGSAVYSSVHDLLRFGMYHVGDRVPGQARILADSTRLAMQRLATPDPDPREEGYGLGWLVMEDDNGYRRVSHTGGMPGVSTLLHLYPEEDLVVAAVTNRSGGAIWLAAHEVASLLLPGYRETSAERRAAAARTAGEPEYTTPPELLGAWSGVVHVQGDTVPIELRFQPDGDVHARLGDGLLTLVNDASYVNGELTGAFTGTIPAEDALLHPHVVLLALRLQGGVLSGAATAYTADEPAYFALSSYAELKRTQGDSR